MNTPVPSISTAEIVTELRIHASSPLDVGQTDDIPVHLRRLVALRDQPPAAGSPRQQPAPGDAS